MIGRTNCINLDAYSNYSNTIITNRKTSSIIVDYPVGYECSCSHGDTTYVADNTSGQQIFRVKEIGVWTIEIDEASGYANQTVIVSDLGTIQSITLMPAGFYHPIENYIVHDIYTFNAQKNLTSCTFDLSETGPHIYAPKAASSYIEGYLEEPMPIKKWMKNMVVTYTGKGYMLTVGLKTDLSLAYTSVSGNLAVYNDGGRNTQKTDYTVSLDISELAALAEYNNQSYYFVFRTAGSSANSYVGNLTIHDLYFE